MDDIQSRRVVSLLPSATDILIALDCQSLLVGCSHEVCIIMMCIRC